MCTGSSFQYYFIVACCNLFSCNGSVVLCVLTRHNYCGNHGHPDHQVALAFRCIQWHNNVNCCIGCHIELCSCVTRTTQINVCTGLLPEVLCMFRHQLCIKCDLTAAFLPHQGKPLVQGLMIVMTLLVTILVFILWCFGHSKVVAINVDTICHLASE